MSGMDNGVGCLAGAGIVDRSVEIGERVMILDLVDREPTLSVQLNQPGEQDSWCGIAERGAVHGPASD